MLANIPYMQYSLLIPVSVIALDEEQYVELVSADFAKAFDHVDHETIMTKLVDLGVPQVLIRWLHSFMSNRQKRVKVGEVVSEWASPNGGMPRARG